MNAWPLVTFVLFLAWAWVARVVVGAEEFAQWGIAAACTAATWFFVITPVRAVYRRKLLVEMRDAGLPPAQNRDEWRVNVGRLREIKKAHGG